jgi:hypothetical protein
LGRGVENKDPTTGTFLAGNKSARPGSRKGVRNRLHADFIAAAQEHFEQVGKVAFEIVFRESPKDYLKIISGILPKEFILEDGRLESMSDEEISEYFAEIRQLKSQLGQIGEDRGGAGSGANPSSERKQIEILPPLREAKRIPRGGPKSS